MKRQGTLRSSSSGRDAAAAAAALSADHQTSTVHHVANSVGCMAGVFQLISTKYRTRRKFLTFGRRQHEKQLTTTYSSPRQSKPNSPARKGRERFDDYNAKNAGLKEGSGEIWRLSCDVPRSPTIPPDIRRSNSLNSPENLRSRSPVTSVVARLMGLEDTPPSPPPPQRESAVEKKKRKLLGALEKCDEDLQALKRIIESVRSTDRSKTPAPPPLVSVGKGRGMAAMKKCTDPMNGINEEQPSPVSVLEDFCDSPPPSSTGGWNSSTKRTQNDTCRLGRVPLLQLQRKKPGEDNVKTTNFCFHNNNRLHVPRSLLHPKSYWTTTVSPPQSRGETMDDAVNEVCKDVEMGQKREIERLGVVVDDFIYRDLIEEMIKDLMGQLCHVESCLPFDKCKRKLRF